MPDEKPGQDDLVKTSEDDITLSETELDDVAGGDQQEYYKIHME